MIRENVLIFCAATLTILALSECSGIEVKLGGDDPPSAPPPPIAIAADAAVDGASASSDDDAPPIVGKHEGLYVGLCVNAFTYRQPVSALRFYTRVKILPGKLTMILHPLKGWPTAAATVSTNEIRGYPVHTTADLISGQFTASIPKLPLEAEANSINGRDLMLENVVLNGELVLENGTAPERFCAILSGQIVSPFKAELLADGGNTCVFVRVSDGAPLPKLAEPEFVCPLP